MSFNFGLFEYFSVAHEKYKGWKHAWWKHKWVGSIPYFSVAQPNVRKHVFFGGFYAFLGTISWGSHQWVHQWSTISLTGLRGGPSYPLAIITHHLPPFGKVTGSWWSLDNALLFVCEGKLPIYCLHCNFIRLGSIFLSCTQNHIKHPTRTRPHIENVPHPSPLIRNTPRNHGLTSRMDHPQTSAKIQATQTPWRSPASHGGTCHWACDRSRASSCNFGETFRHADIFCLARWYIWYVLKVTLKKNVMKISQVWKTAGWATPLENMKVNWDD